VVGALDRVPKEALDGTGVGPAPTPPLGLPVGDTDVGIPLGAPDTAVAVGCDVGVAVGTALGLAADGGSVDLAEGEGVGVALEVCATVGATVGASVGAAVTVGVTVGHRESAGEPVPVCRVTLRVQRSPRWSLSFIVVPMRWQACWYMYPTLSYGTSIPSRTDGFDAQRYVQLRLVVALANPGNALVRLLLYLELRSPMTMRGRAAVDRLASHCEMNPALSSWSALSNDKCAVKMLRSTSGLVVRATTRATDRWFKSQWVGVVAVPQLKGKGRSRYVMSPTIAPGIQKMATPSDVSSVYSGNCAGV
jgi:hypothetical protein